MLLNLTANANLLLGKKSFMLFVEVGVCVQKSVDTTKQMRNYKEALLFENLNKLE